MPDSEHDAEALRLYRLVWGENAIPDGILTEEHREWLKWSLEEEERLSHWDRVDPRRGG